MNKRIYYNNAFIEFKGDVAQASQNQPISNNPEISEKELKKLIDALLSGNILETSESGAVKLLNINNFTMALDYLKKKFYYIEAAGGLIKKGDRYLFILRYGKWDLPKGKLEKGETIEHAAVRECEEECNIKELSITRPLNSTYHFYKYKESYAFKQTFWFEMISTYNGNLKPQTEENIERVEWFTKKDIENIVFKNTYLTISDVINNGISF